VFLDGIFGPWFLPVVARELAPTGAEVAYVVLRIDLDRALCRATTRPQPGEPSMVRQMHAAFADLGDYERHGLAVGDLTPEDVASEFLRRRASGDFRLDLSRVRAVGP
jgi:hypothetical protein